MLSGELATFLSGRYVEINALPMSFKEYMEARSGQNPEKEFLNYLQYGGFPYAAVNLKDNRNMFDTYFDGIYNTIVVKDIEERSMRKNQGSDLHEISNIPLLKTISSFLASSVGSLISLRNIANYLSSSPDRSSSVATVSRYVKALEESYLFLSRACNECQQKTAFKKYS